MSKKQINMASLVTAAVATDMPAAAPATVTAKEAPVLAAIAANKAFVNVTALSKVKGVDKKSVPGIAASLVKKGFVANEPSPFGTLYTTTDEGAEAAALLV